MSIRNCLAGQLWAAIHGIVMLHQSGMLAHGPDYRCCLFLGLTMLKGAGARIGQGGKGKNKMNSGDTGRANVSGAGPTPGQCRARGRRLRGPGRGRGRQRGPDVAQPTLRPSRPTWRRAQLGAYAVPINWNFTPEEASYILEDCAAKVLVAHSDLLAPIAPGIPPGVTVLVVPTPEEIATAYNVPPEKRRPPEGTESLGTPSRLAARPTPSRRKPPAAA